MLHGCVYPAENGRLSRCAGRIAVEQQVKASRSERELTEAATKLTVGALLEPARWEEADKW